MQPWPAAQPIETERLSLRPLRVEDVDEMAPVLDDERLHEYTGGRPVTYAELRARYDRQVTGHSPDGAHGWLNWIVRLRAAGTPVGAVQATLTRDGSRTMADVAWVIASAHQRRGYGREAAGAMVGWLREQGVELVTAHIHPEHTASIAVARHLGLAAGETRSDGEVRWGG